MLSTLNTDRSQMCVPLCVCVYQTAQPNFTSPLFSASHIFTPSLGKLGTFQPQTGLRAKSASGQLLLTGSFLEIIAIPFSFFFWKAHKTLPRSLSHCRKSFGGHLWRLFFNQEQPSEKHALFPWLLLGGQLGWEMLCLHLRLSSFAGTSILFGRAPGLLWVSISFCGFAGCFPRVKWSP